MSGEAMEGRSRASFLAGGSSAILFLLCFLIQCAAAQQEQLLSSTERSALLRLRSSLGLQSRDWPLKGNPCTNWVGITCRDGRVTGINISGFKRTRLGRSSPRFAVGALANLTYLSSFNASGFLLPGPIPDWLGSTVRSLQTLDLRSCSVTGAVPGSLGSLSRLRFLYLSDNNLTGNIDSNLGRLSKLLVLSLSGNFLTGTIPDELSMLGNLTILDLSSNYITGPIPSSLGSLSGLRVLNLSDNSLTASVPAQLSNLSQLTILDLSKNSISGSLPVELSGLMSLKDMRIGNNILQGQFPENLLPALSQLNYLDVSGNNFTGKLPRISSRGNARITGNAVFNFSNNMFYGTLNLSSLGLFSSLDLSGNYFQGEVVTDNAGSNKVSLEKNCLQIIPKQRSLLDCQEFYSQRNLSFDDFGLPEPNRTPVLKESVSMKRLWLYISIGIGGGLVLILLLLLILVFLRRRFRAGDSGQRERSADFVAVSEGESEAIPKEPFILSAVGDSFSFDQIVQATYDFNKSNLIKNGHSGSLYLGLLDGQAPVVIKRITSEGYSNAKEPYAVELEFFARTSNVRLVPLLGHCLEMEREKFLVYKYMPNRDLASSFYRAVEYEDGSSRSLDWITRLKIAIGAAEGLSYLHHECSPPIVHRDIQASSILLDDKFEVRLGSLSEVHIQEGDPHHNVIARLLHKPQTSEQGPSGPSTATCSYDVFCFGKVLLELVTGKIGISQSGDAASREWLEQTLPYIRGYDKELVTKIMDPSLIVDEDLLEEVWAMAIVARSCLNPKPTKRPPMKYVLRALENPLKVVRQENNFGSLLRLTNTSSTKSWSATLFRSWQNSSSSGHSTGGMRQSGGMGSHSSGANDHSSTHKRLSSEIFPEPVGIADVEKADGH